jgi:hypothetical protein
MTPWVLSLGGIDIRRGSLVRNVGNRVRDNVRRSLGKPQQIPRSILQNALRSIEKSL